MEPVELTPVEQRVLRALAHPRFRGAYLPVWRIVEALDVPSTGQAVVAVLRRLERRGFVIRLKEPGGSHWRAVLVA